MDFPTTIYRVGNIGEYGIISFDNEWDAVEAAWRYGLGTYAYVRHPWKKRR